MLRLLMVVVLCANSARSDDEWDPWRQNGTNGNKGHLNEAERIEALQNYHNDLAYARLQAVEMEELKGLLADGVLTTGEPVGQATNEPTTTDPETTPAPQPIETKFQVLRDRFHKVMKHRTSATVAPPRVNGIDSVTQSAHLVANFPIRARTPARIKELATQATIFSKPLVPVSLLSTRIVTPIPHFEETTKSSNEEGEWHTTVSMSEDEKEFLALLSPSQTTQSLLDVQSEISEQPRSQNSDFEISAANRGHESSSASEAPLSSLSSALPPTTKTPIPRSQVADLASSRLPLFVHGLDTEDLEMVENAKSAARKQPGGGNWLVPYYPNRIRQI